MTERLAALKAWAGRTGARISAAGKATGSAIAHAPWPRIGLWAGGTVGVLAITLVLFLTFADWNALRGPVSRMASAATGREILIRGDLDVNPWSLTPELSVGGLYIGNPSQYRERGAFAEVTDADASVRLLPLFIGRFDIVRLDLNGADISLYRSADGVSNWAPNAGRGKPFDLPAIRQFSLRDGRIRLQDDKRKIVLTGDFTTQESADPRNPGQFELNGEGTINNRRFLVEVTGAPLLNVQRGRPYAFQADVRAGPTHIKANGQIDRPFNLSGWRADIDASGADLADLYQLTGLALPNTPPYTLRGRIERNGDTYGMPRVAGRVGDSDLRGAFTASRRANDRLFLDGDFRTNSLDFDDLMAVLGGAPSTGRGETASEGQRHIAANMAAQGRLLPDANLDISRVRNMDARVSYRAARVRSPRVPLRGLALDIKLDRGLLELDPMTLELSQGRITGAVAINARESNTPRVDLDARLSGARLQSILALSGEPPLEGTLVGRARLHGRGASVRDAAATANGDVSFAVPNGNVREAFAELTGINVIRGLGLLLSDDTSEVPIRCGVASFTVSNGIARSRTILIDTENVLIAGQGQVSLRDETMNIRVQGDPKEARLVRLMAPITISGHLRDPHIGVEAGSAIAQGGVAALLASLVAPLAAILPFVDAGLAEDTNCAALLAGRRPEPAESVQRERSDRAG